MGRPVMPLPHSPRLLQMNVIVSNVASMSRGCLVGWPEVCLHIPEGSIHLSSLLQPLVHALSWTPALVIIGWRGAGLW